MTIQIEPVAKPRMTQRDKWTQRPSVVKYRMFCDKLREQYKKPILGTVEIDFYIPMPNSWSKTKRIEKLGQPHTQKPDIDNLIKSVLDALCKDDSHVWNVKATKHWSETGRIEIR